MFVRLREVREKIDMRFQLGVEHIEILIDSYKLYYGHRVEPHRARNGVKSS